MHRHLHVVIAALAALQTVLPVAASASSAVLTSGGAAEKPGVQLETQATGKVTFASSTSGGGAVTCSASDFVATVQTNPAAPGTATLSVTSISFSGCTSTLQGTTGGERVSFANLPYAMSISDAASPATVTLRPGGSGPIQLTLAGSFCPYESSPISTPITASGFRFDVTFDSASSNGLPGPCLRSLRSSGTYGPFRESVSLQPITVN